MSTKKAKSAKVPPEEHEPEALTASKEQFSEWYHQVIKVADIIDQRYPMQGFLVYKPYGYEIFDRIMKVLEGLLAKTGHKKVYFPAVIPERLLAREASHIAGFHDEVFWITKGGATDMVEHAALRPTSETVMYEMLRLWIRSWRDLPVKIHQSTTVWRYETKHTRPLIRDREIHWNEAHTSHATAEEAAAQCKEGMRIYQELFRALAIPAIWLNVADVFAGAESAVEPYTVFPDGRGLEMGSVNNLGQRFSRAFGVKFKRADGSEDFVYQTCYGVSERLLAALVAVHGDDKGLVLPPDVAPIQVVIVPILFEASKASTLEHARRLRDKLAERFRVHLDEREASAGAKFYDWELRGVPIRIEIGPRDIERKTVVVARRDTGEKITEIEGKIATRISSLLSEIHSSLLQRADAYHKSKIAEARSEKEISAALKRKMLAKVMWCGSIECASSIEKSVNAHFLGYDVEERTSGECVCGKPAAHIGYVGKTY
ncbi:MAG: proline--tRNA ligase [Candidatus Aenigmatarchaeota archaeon]